MWLIPTDPPSWESHVFSRQVSKPMFNWPSVPIARPLSLLPRAVRVSDRPTPIIPLQSSRPPGPCFVCLLLGTGFGFQYTR